MGAGVCVEVGEDVCVEICIASGVGGVQADSSPPARQIMGMMRTLFI